jgi:single-strand DNA-binding protein
MFNNSGINRVFLVGTIEKEPRWHKGSTAATSLCFTIATKELINKNNVDVEHIEIHNIKVAGDHPDLARIELKKGQMLHITGKIQTKMTVDEQQVKRYKTEILAMQMQVLQDVEAQQYQIQKSA